MLTAAARRGCLSPRVLPRDAARLYRQVARCHAERAVGGAGALPRSLIGSWTNRRRLRPIRRARRIALNVGARKDTGGDGWADVWKRHCFAWEYKGQRANLDAAFAQLRQYALALENPPLLIVSDLRRFRIRTNWTNSVSRTYEFDLDDLTDNAVRDRLKWAFSDPERLRHWRDQARPYRAGGGGLRGSRPDVCGRVATTRGTRAPALPHLLWLTARPTSLSASMTGPIAL